MKLHVRHILVASLALVCAASWAQIYSCVDAKGRKLTSDRPMAECADREQKELNSNATVKRTVKPVMTADEQRAYDDKQKAEIEERVRLAEERRKERALLSRYPDRASHDRERNEALAKIDEVTLAASRRIGELAVQRKEIDVEMEFYKKDPSKAPFSLRRQVEDNTSSVAAQKRFMAGQDAEKKRTNARFDEELVRLKTLWAATSAGVSKPAAKASLVDKKQ
jgi:hypothetical protein